MDTSTPANWIAKATRYRYTLPILAELERDQGCKFVTLVRRLEASDRAMRQALDYLVDLGWVERNPGYGHPSRPEYVTTQDGSKFARLSLRVWEELQKWGQEEVARERWPLVVLAAVEHGCHSYSEIQRECRISPRALSISLKRLTNSGLLNRTIVSGNPPASEYRLTPWGTALAGVLTEF